MNQTSESQPANKTYTICGKGPRSNARMYPCGLCNNGFHSACTSFASILKETGGTHKVCPQCIASANSNCSTLHQVVPSSHGSAASSGANTPNNRSRSNSQTSHSSQHSQHSAKGKALGKEKTGDQTSMELILTKLEKLDQVEDLLSTISQQLEPLKLIPQLLERVEATEKEVADLKRGQDELRQEVEVLKASAAAGNSPSNERLEHLEQQNAHLTSQVKALLETRTESSDELVIGGVNCADIFSADLKKLSLAILCVVSPSLVEHDILDARLLPSRPAAMPSAGTSGERANTAAVSGDGTLNAVRNIVVSMHSPSLVKAVVSAKAKYGKLHSSRVNSTRLLDAGVTALNAGHININEMLPADVYKLRRAVFQKGKEHKFKAFIRRGQIFARKGKRDAPTLISSTEDLDNFLD